MNPGNNDSCPENAFRGYTHRANVGRDYETNVGYRQNYDGLDNGKRPATTPEEWPQDEQGLYKGKGPRSYRRRDDRTLEDINDRMCDNPYLDASDIEVAVQQAKWSHRHCRRPGG